MYWGWLETRLAASIRWAYRAAFNEHRRHIVIRPQPAPPVGDRRAFARGNHWLARSRWRIRRSQPSDRKEAQLVARPHPDQPVLRIVHPDAVLVRTGGQAA